jgi:hypothetical protein
MMKTSFSHITDIHRRSLSHGLKAFKHLDTIRGILFRGSIIDFVLVHYILFFLFFSLTLEGRKASGTTNGQIY